MEGWGFEGKERERKKGKKMKRGLIGGVGFSRAGGGSAELKRRGLRSGARAG